MAGVNTTVNILNYGAKGDGTTDDTQAFVNALAYLKSQNGGVLFIPNGIFIFKQQLVLDRVIIKGLNQACSEIRMGVALGTGVAAIKVVNRGRGFQTGMEDVSLTCSIGSRVIGVRNHYCDGVSTGTQCFLNRVNISNFDVGLNIDGASHCSFTNCNIQDNYYNVFFKDDQGDHTFFNCIFDGASYASVGINGDKEGHPETLFLRCHFGFSPYGVYQEMPLNPDYEQAMMVEWVFDGARFESIGNAAIYTEGWNLGWGKGRGIRNCTFRNVGFSWDVTGDFVLPNKPATASVWANDCEGIIIYDPGYSPFTHRTNSDPTVGAIKLSHNNALWNGYFNYSAFDTTSAEVVGFPNFLSFSPTTVFLNGKTSGQANILFTSEIGSTDGNNPCRKIIIKFNNYVNSTSTADVFNFPVPLKNSPVIASNLANFPASALTITNKSLSFKPQNKTVYNGYLTLMGE